MTELTSDLRNRPSREVWVRESTSFRFMGNDYKDVVNAYSGERVIRVPRGRPLIPEECYVYAGTVIEGSGTTAMDKGLNELGSLNYGYKARGTTLDLGFDGNMHVAKVENGKPVVATFRNLNAYGDRVSLGGNAVRTAGRFAYGDFRGALFENIFTANFHDPHIEITRIDSNDGNLWDNELHKVSQMGGNHNGIKLGTDCSDTKIIGGISSDFTEAALLIANGASGNHRISAGWTGQVSRHAIEAYSTFSINNCSMDQLQQEAVKLSTTISGGRVGILQCKIRGASLAADGTYSFINIGDSRAIRIFANHFERYDASHIPKFVIEYTTKATASYGRNLNQYTIAGTNAYTLGIAGHGVTAEDATNAKVGNEDALS